jgi:hypothetical protein
MDRYRKAASRALALLVALISLAAFAESYYALAQWALEHQMPVPAAWAFPLLIDTFMAVAEIALFIALAESWSLRSRLWAWAVLAGGLAVSTAANAGHVHSADWTSHATAAVPPLAAAVALTVGLGVLKRTRLPAHVPVPAPTRVSEPALAIMQQRKPRAARKSAPLQLRDSIRAIRAEYPDISLNALATRAGCSWATARKYTTGMESSLLRLQSRHSS